MLISIKVSAVLKKKFLYKKDDVWVSVPKGTEITVDENEGVALIGMDHVQVQHKDYQVKFPH